MNILYLGSSSDFHIDLWVKYFTEKHKVFLLSEKEDYLANKDFKDVQIIYTYGFLTKFLNFIKSRSHRLHQLNKLVSIPIYVFLLKKYIKKYDIDIVHAHSVYQGWLASYTQKDIPVVFTPMGSDVIIHASSNLLYRYMAKKAFNRANIITNDSKIQQKKGFAVGARSEKNFIIQNGVDSKIFFPKENTIKQDNNVMDDEFLIFSPRGLDEIYNIKKILINIRALINRNYKVKCMIAFPFGEKKLSKLKDLVQKLDIFQNVIWVGGLSYIDMPRYYNAADLVISIPSSDSSPKSVYEAMFCNKPVIVSDLDWVYEYLDSHECIVKVRLDDDESLQNEIIKLIEDNMYRNKISNNAGKIAKKYYDYYENMKEMEMIMIDELKSNSL